MRHALLMTAVLLVSTGAQAQQTRPDAPLFECRPERALRLLEPEQPAGDTMHTLLASAFIFDFASGLMRWRTRQDDGLTNAQRWTVTQRGGSGNDWVAAFGQSDTGNGTQQVLRIRTWAPQGVRFVLFDWNGAAIVGTCR